MTLVKHSQRTIRKPCKSCGRTDLYWAHDTDRPEGAFECESCNVKGKFVLIDADGSRHACKDGAPEASPVSSEPASVPPVNGSPAGPGADKLATAAALLEALSPKVDAAEVQRLISAEHDDFAKTLLSKVDAKVAEVQIPIRVEIKTDTEVRELPGLTHKAVPAILTTLNAREHVLMVGPAGTGKSTIAEQCAEALGLSYYAISLSPQTPASSLLGYMQAAGEYVASLYRQAYEHGGVFHFDEFDNAHPSVLAVINASLANGHMAFPDRMVKRHADFKVCASANTYGRGPDRQYVGRQALDAATLDRFSIETIDIDEGLEKALCHGTGASDSIVTEVLRYVRGLRRNAETHKMALIFSPRASVGLCRLIHAGRPVNEAIESRARRGASDQDWAKVTSGVSLPRI